MSKLKINILTSYISQIYVVIISICVLPLYLKNMGAEAYGLVGYFATIQIIFSLLDFGLTPTISRQTALYNTGKVTALKYRQLLRAISIIFVVVAIVGVYLLILLSESIAINWLKLEKLQLKEVVLCLNVMAFCVGLKWISGLYKGIIIGFEKIVWLSIANVVIATLRFIGVYIYMHLYGFTIKNFFYFQLIVAVIELVIFFIKNQILLPSVNNKKNIGWSLEPVKNIIMFSLTIALTSFIWVIITQIDKFLLSGILKLSEYGYFTLAVLVAGGIIQISSPISNSIMPRMASLYASKEYEKFIKLYINATKFIAIICVTAGILLSVLSKQVLYVWTGDPILVNKTSSILSLYVLGNTALVLTAFPYYLQYAKGNVKLNLIGNILLLSILMPLIICAARKYGAIGASWVWFISHLLYLIFWVSFVHAKIEPGINLRWYKSIINIVIITSISSLVLKEMMIFSNNRLILLLQISLISGICLLISIFFSVDFNKIKNKFKKNNTKNRRY